jgi:hypothetical protein
VKEPNLSVLNYREPALVREVLQIFGGSDSTTCECQLQNVEYTLIERGDPMAITTKNPLLLEYSN